MCLVALFFLLIGTSLYSQKLPFDEFSWYIQQDELQHANRFGDIYSEDVLFVSLGSHCQTAMQLNYFKLRKFSFPFDWLLSDHDDNLIKILDEDFHLFLDKSVLFSHPYTSWWLENSYYKLEFRHDWPFSDSDVVINPERFKKYIEIIQEKYERRIVRFRNLKNFKGKVFFIRTASCLDGHYYWGDNVAPTITCAQTITLRNALCRFFPDLDFTLVIVNYSPVTEALLLQFENILEFTVTNRSPVAYDAFRKMFSAIKKMAGLEHIGDVSNPSINSTHSK